MIYELRTYVVPEGRMPELLSLFEDVIFGLFERAKITPVSFWMRKDASAFVYVCKFESEAAKEKAWQTFLKDPEWVAAWRDRSDPEDPMVAEVSSEILIPVQFPASTR